MAKDSNATWFVAVLLAVGAAGVLWYYLRPTEPAAPPPVMAEPPPAEVEPEEPRHPLPPPAEPEEPTEPMPPLPPLDDSDTFFESSLSSVLGDGIAELLVEESLIEKSVTTLDNLTRSRVATRVRPIGPVSGQFEVDALDERTFLLSERNYARYDGLVNMLTSADPDVLVDTYQRFYPLLQEAYVMLGYPDAYLNDRVVEVIDHLLDTPTVEGPIQLVQPHVLYEFADPDLEALSSGQKMLLRMGRGNAERVMTTLRQLRARIAAEQPDQS